MTRWQYNGDVDVTNGGYWASTDPDARRYGYSSVVRVQPCSDAGGPDNMFWVETLMVLIPDRAHREKTNLLGCVGLDEETLADATPAARRAMLIDACLAYGHYDQDDIFALGIPQSQIVQIGPDDPFWEKRHPNGDTFTADTKIRANWKLANWVRTNYLKGQ